MILGDFSGYLPLYVGTETYDGTSSDVSLSGGPISYYTAPVGDPSVLSLSGSTTINILRPKVNNSYKMKSPVIRDTNFSGDVKFVKQTYWPDYTKLTFPIAWLTEVEAESLFEFLADRLGAEITLRFRDEVYKGIITNPFESLQHVRLLDGKIEFEGVKQ